MCDIDIRDATVVIIKWSTIICYCIVSFIFIYSNNENAKRNMASVSIFFSLLYIFITLFKTLKDDWITIAQLIHALDDLPALNQRSHEI